MKLTNLLKKVVFSERRNLTSHEKKIYVMKDKEDFIILSKIKELEKKNLSKEDKKIISLIRTQLKKNWRLPLINYLNQLLTKQKTNK